MPTVVVAHFKTNIYEYLEALQKSTLDKLYEEPATCLAIFRLLPSLARQLVMSLLFSTQVMSKADLRQWIKNDKESLLKFEEALDKLQKLHIMIEQENKTIALNSSFKQKFQECLTGGGSHQSFGKLYNKPHRHSQSNSSHKLPDIKLLDDHAKTKWEEILHFMVGTDRMSLPGASVLKVVTKANLMREKEGKGLEITNKGFQFLLQDVNTQVWAFLIQYLDLASEDYSVEGLTDTQRQLLDDLTNYGLIYRPKVKIYIFDNSFKYNVVKSSKRYYPTRLATTLTSGNSAIVSNTTSNNPADDDDSATEQGFIIVETNYKLYAYTSSQLQISVLNLFCNLQFQFSNMVTAEITRESVRKALKHGITASQIISYLTSHAHPQMKKRPALLPSTVVDQIQLWEMELNRLIITDCYLYKDFRTFADYEVVLKHANTLGVVVWSNDSKRMIGIAEAGHERVKAFIKRKIVQRRTNGGDTTSSAGGTPAR
ncbi:1512_t:CDS:10 [Cetraspora pellucida]|uniref:RNA polymerase II transcription factor B subunit 2 n=1 Tax=Cetraspora pellucida TaxID=1433469 RepID=A0A9N9F5P3_9GLOM|nr:1512_t:CDS:10 [Cetraspora pellucida]